MTPSQDECLLHPDGGGYEEGCLPCVLMAEARAKEQVAQYRAVLADAAMGPNLTSWEGSCNVCLARLKDREPHTEECWRGKAAALLWAKGTA